MEGVSRCHEPEPPCLQTGGLGGQKGRRAKPVSSACQKSLFASLSKFSELYKSSENLGFQWRREIGEAPPVADQASLFRGRLPNRGYAVSAVWSEPTVYPFWGYLRAKSRLTAVTLRNAPAGAIPHTPFTCKGYAAYRPNRRYAAFHLIVLSIRRWYRAFHQGGLLL